VKRELLQGAPRTPRPPRQQPTGSFLSPSITPNNRNSGKNEEDLGDLPNEWRGRFIPDVKYDKASRIVAQLATPTPPGRTPPKKPKGEDASLPTPCTRDYDLARDAPRSLTSRGNGIDESPSLKRCTGRENKENFCPTGEIPGRNSDNSVAHVVSSSADPGNVAGDRLYLGKRSIPSQTMPGPF